MVVVLCVVTAMHVEREKSDRKRRNSLLSRTRVLLEAADDLSIRDSDDDA